MNNKDMQFVITETGRNAIDFSRQEQETFDLGKKRGDTRGFIKGQIVMGVGLILFSALPLSSIIKKQANKIKELEAEKVSITAARPPAMLNLVQTNDSTFVLRP